MDEVVGQFDWIVDFEYLRDYFGESYTGIRNYESSNILVVGCGTSTLSSDIATNLKAGSLLSVDNDEKCVSYMREKHKADLQMKWEVFDMIEDALSGNCDSMGECSFDLVVDKGSLDAMLVEGSITMMLLEVFRVLKEGGVYFICSLHAPALLRSLLEAPPLSYEVTFPALSSAKEEELSSVDGRCQTVAICRKCPGSHRSISTEDMSATENAVMDQFYQTSCPFLTPERRSTIEALMASSARVETGEGEEGAASPMVSLEDFHRCVFQEEMLLGYTIDLFLEDLEGFPLSQEGAITLDEALHFLSTKQ